MSAIKSLLLQIYKNDKSVSRMKNIHFIAWHIMDILTLRGHPKLSTFPLTNVITVLFVRGNVDNVMDGPLNCEHCAYFVICNSQVFLISIN